jgi:hypothetical protein
LTELYLVLWIVYIIHHILFSTLHLHSLGHRFSSEIFSFSSFTVVSVHYNRFYIFYIYFHFLAVSISVNSARSQGLPPHVLCNHFV